MDITCEVCGSSSFYVRHGRTVCRECHTESQEHGHETVISDETIGTFSGLNLRKKAIRKEKPKKISEPPRSFTTTDAFTCALRGWVDEILALGAKPTLKHLVFTLWARYLQTLGMAFTPDGGKPGLGPFVVSRDVQIAMDSSKMILTGLHRSQLRKARVAKPSGEKDSSDEMDALDMSREVRRKRARRRRKFFKALAGESDATTDSDCSNHSFASVWSCNSSLVEDSSSSFSLSQTMSTSSVGQAQESRNEVFARASALDNILGASNNRKRKLDSRRLESTRLCSPRLVSVFSCFALGVLLNDDNEFTLSDLAYWLRSGALAYCAAPKHFLPDMSLRGREDTTLFQREHAPTVNVLRSNVCQLASTLRLKEMQLSAHDTLSKVLRRHLRELALPADLHDFILQACGAVPNVLQPVHRPPAVPKPRVLPFAEFITPDTRSLSLILFALKYLYGLDDVSEDFYSSSARKHNDSLPIGDGENAQSSRSFVFSEWLRLSKKRAFLAARHSHLLHTSLASLFPGVELCDEEIVNAAQHRSEMLTEMNKQNKSFNILPNKLSKACVSGLQVLLNGMMESSPAARASKKLDIATSLTPLFDFSKYLVNDAVCDTLSETDRSAISALLDCAECTVDRAQQESPDSQHMVLDVPSKQASHQIRLEESSDRYDPEIRQTLVPRGQTALPDQSYAFRARYWLLHNTRVNKFTLLFHKPCSMNRLVGALPENFSWVLEYLSAATSVPASEIYADLILVEREVISKNKRLFGSQISK